MTEKQLKIPLMAQANMHKDIRTYGSRVRVQVSPPINLQVYAEGKPQKDSVDIEEFGLEKIAIQLSETVQELLGLFGDVHKSVKDALDHLGTPGPATVAHLQHKRTLVGTELMQIMRRYEDFKHKNGL